MQCLCVFPSHPHVNFLECSVWLSKTVGLWLCFHPSPIQKLEELKRFGLRWGKELTRHFLKLILLLPFKNKWKGGNRRLAAKYVGCSDLQLRKLAGQIQKQIREKCTKTTGKVLGFPYSHLAFSLELDKLVGQIQRQIQIKMHKGWYKDKYREKCKRADTKRNAKELIQRQIQREMHKSWYKDKYRKKFIGAKWRTKVGFSLFSPCPLSWAWQTNRAPPARLDLPQSHTPCQPFWNIEHNITFLSIWDLNVDSNIKNLLGQDFMSQRTNGMIFTSPPYSFNLFWKYHFYMNLDLSTICHEVFLLGWNSPWATLDFLSRSLIAHCIIAYIARRLKYCKA